MFFKNLRNALLTVSKSRDIFVSPCITNPSFIKILRPFSSSSSLNRFEPPEPKKWLKYNEKVFPPQEPGEERRPAFVCHMKTNVKYSYKKMWYIAAMMRGLRVEEALNQLQFISQKGGADIARDTLEEARELAVKEHNVEFHTNLWVAESFVGKGYLVKGARKHAKRRIGEVRHQYIHYFVRLEEGEPPEHYYYWNRPLSPQEKLDDYIKEKRDRTIDFAL